MRSCEEVHKEYDKYANSKVKISSLPTWMHVSGTVAWYVFQGSYQTLPEGWSTFWEKFREATTSKISGPPGDVYVCSPDEHKGDERSMITILWTPVKA